VVTHELASAFLIARPPWCFIDKGKRRRPIGSTEEMRSSTHPRVRSFSTASPQPQFRKIWIICNA